MGVKVRKQNRATDQSYIDQNGKVLGYPDSQKLLTIDSVGMVRELISTEDYPSERGGNTLKTDRMEWVQSKLKEEGVSYKVIGENAGREVYPPVTAVSFSSDPAKPAICYLVPIHQTEVHESGGFSIADHSSSAVMGISLVSQLKQTEQELNVIVCFVSANYPHKAFHELQSLIDSGQLDVRISSITELQPFTGPDFSLKTTNELDSEVFTALTKRTGLKIKTDKISYKLTSEFTATVPKTAIGSIKKATHHDDSGNKEESLKDEQIEFVSTRAFKAMSRMLWQQSVMLSNFYADRYDR